MAGGRDTALFDFAPFGLSLRVEDRAVSLCFDKAQHDQLVEPSNCAVLFPPSPF